MHPTHRLPLTASTRYQHTLNSVLPPYVCAPFSASDRALVDEMAAEAGRISSGGHAMMGTSDETTLVGGLGGEVCWMVQEIRAGSREQGRQGACGTQRWSGLCCNLPAGCKLCNATGGPIFLASAAPVPCTSRYLHLDSPVPPPSPAPRLACTALPELYHLLHMYRLDSPVPPGPTHHRSPCRRSPRTASVR
jgi:hypothetical protein